MAWQSPKTNWATPDGAADRMKDHIIALYQRTNAILDSRVSFIVASAATINKLLYKPGTTIAPKLVAGKAITVWYSSVFLSDIWEIFDPGTR